MRAIIILFATLSIAACATDCPEPAAPSLPKTRVVDTACSWVKPITAVPEDTLETKQQILAHDLAVAKNCPKVPR
ncbi:hypothetical protein [Burkholderia pseudomallei]|uniref:hypothetical protein n=1 Tax=Burkholderia pseudomallei TaxID=28450 RepID=UPI002932DAB0|nr:hypothetical protein [Burkholderia pseudomallei]MDV2160690.1 hypothetical protein [Burkholderia pseudomallei]MDV2234300.1 hypothetical protein [Burkholderia pseudomallei]